MNLTRGQTTKAKRYEAPAALAVFMLLVSGGNSFPRADDDLLGASARALQGDAEYGEYLAGECVTCHNDKSAENGMPYILGMPTEYFIDALYQYREGVRENPVMKTVVDRLGDEEMAALAAYFVALESN